MLTRAGWSVIESQDISDEYALSSQRQIKAMQENRKDFITIVGATEYDNRLAKYASKVTALGEGRLRRELYFARMT